MRCICDNEITGINKRPDLCKECNKAIEDCLASMPIKEDKKSEE